MQWHLIIEEFGPTMENIKGPKNIVADTLSHLKMTSDTESLDSEPWLIVMVSILMTFQKIPFQSCIPYLIMNKRKIKLFLSKHKLQLVHTLLKSFDNFRMNTGMVDTVPLIIWLL
jgi:hypothetical protein